MVSNIVYVLPLYFSVTFGGLVAFFSGTLDHCFQFLSVVGQNPQCFTMFVTWQTSKIIFLYFIPTCDAFDTAGASTMPNASHILSLLVQVIECQTAVWKG